MNGEPAQVAAIVERIKPLLAGLPAPIQGAALADCLAIWLAGHVVRGDEAATLKLRANLLAAHCIEVRDLTSINAKIMGTTP